MMPTQPENPSNTEPATKPASGSPGGIPNGSTGGSLGGTPIWLLIAMGLSLLGLLLAVTALIALRSGSSDPETTGPAATNPPPATQPSEALARLTVPEFTLTNQHGQTVDESIFDGRYTVLDFIFTNCPFACPGMTAQMALVQERTDAPLVSISVDPDNDTPERLREFASTYGVDHDRWDLLTGQMSTVRRVLDSLGLAIREDTTRNIALEGGGQMRNIDHPTRLILIGPDRSVRGMFSYTSEREINLLIERLNALPAGAFDAGSAGG